MHTAMRAISNNRDSLSFKGKKDGFISLEYFMGNPHKEIAEWILTLPLSIANFSLITFQAAKSMKPYSQKEMRAAIIDLIQKGKLEFIPRDDKAKEKGVLGKRMFRFV